jgi:hypothetical protein
MRQFDYSADADRHLVGIAEYSERHLVMNRPFVTWRASNRPLRTPSNGHHRCGREPISAPESLPSVEDAFLAGALHAGARRRDDGFRRRGQALANELETAGYAAAADRMNAWLAQDDAGSFGRAAVWLSALLEL